MSLTYITRRQGKVRVNVTNNQWTVDQDSGLLINTSKSVSVLRGVRFLQPRSIVSLNPSASLAHAVEEPNIYKRSAWTTCGSVSADGSGYYMLGYGHGPVINSDGMPSDIVRHVAPDAPYTHLIGITRYNVSGMAQWGASINERTLLQNMVWSAHVFATETDVHVMKSVVMPDATDVVEVKVDGVGLDSSYSQYLSAFAYLRRGQSCALHYRFGNNGQIISYAMLNSSDNLLVYNVASGASGHIWMCGTLIGSAITYSPDNGRGSTLPLHTPATWASHVVRGFVIRLRTTETTVFDGIYSRIEYNFVLDYPIQILGEGCDVVVRDFARDVSANMYVTGYITGSGSAFLYNLSGSGHAPSAISVGAGTMFLAKYNASGIAQWATTLLDGNALPICLSTNKSTTDIVVCGYCPTGISTLKLRSPTGSTVFIKKPFVARRGYAFCLRCNAEGGPVFALHVDGSSNNCLTSALLCDNDSLVLCGTYTINDAYMYDSDGTKYSLRAPSTESATYVASFSGNGMYEHHVVMDVSGNEQVDGWITNPGVCTGNGAKPWLWAEGLPTLQATNLSGSFQFKMLEVNQDSARPSKPMASDGHALYITNTVRSGSLRLYSSGVLQPLGVFQGAVQCTVNLEHQTLQRRFALKSLDSRQQGFHKILYNDSPVDVFVDVMDSSRAVIKTDVLQKGVWANMFWYNNEWLIPSHPMIDAQHNGTVTGITVAGTIVANTIHIDSSFKMEVTSGGTGSIVLSASAKQKLLLIGNGSGTLQTTPSLHFNTSAGTLHINSSGYEWGATEISGVYVKGDVMCHGQMFRRGKLIQVHVMRTTDLGYQGVDTVRLVDDGATLPGTPWCFAATYAELPPPMSAYHGYCNPPIRSLRVQGVMECVWDTGGGWLPEYTPVSCGGTGHANGFSAINKLLVGNGQKPLMTPQGLHFDTSAGCLGINTASPQHPVHVSGEVSGVSMYMTHTYVERSDARLKVDLALIENALLRVSKLKGYTYTRGDAQPRAAGVLAQEVLGVLPEAVIQDENGYYAVSYSSIIALLVSAVNELNGRLTRLRASCASPCPVVV